METKSDMFAYIIDKIKTITQEWKHKLSSHGGKEVPLKAVALTIPILSMNVFRLKEVFEEINIIARFWWSSDDKKAFHWYSWKRLCIPKKRKRFGM